MTTPDSFTDDLMNLISDSELELECPNCGKDIVFKLSDIGTSVNCPHCNEVINLEAK